MKEQEVREALKNGASIHSLLARGASHRLVLKIESEIQDSKITPSSEYRFFVNDPEGDGMVFFRSKENRDFYAEKCIKEYADEISREWIGDGVGQIFSGEITALCNEIVIKPQGLINEDGEDEAEVYFGEHESLSDFKMKSLAGSK